MEEKKFRGKVKIRPGQSLFCLNTQTGIITNMGKPLKVDIEERCVYRVALNQKSFLAKLVREGIIQKQNTSETKNNYENNKISRV